MPTEPGKLNSAFENDALQRDSQVELTGFDDTGPSRASRHSRRDPSEPTRDPRGNSHSHSAESRLSTERTGLNQSQDSGLGQLDVDASVSDLTAASSIRDVSCYESKGEMRVCVCVCV